MSNPDVGDFDSPQDTCPECGETENIEDVPGGGDLFVTCHECGYQWHEPLAKEEDRRQEALLKARSDRFHDHPSNPSSCETFTQHAENMGRANTSCPCEED